MQNRENVSGARRVSRAWRRRLRFFGTAVFLGVLVGCFSSLREDDLECEEAVAHLEDCCPGFDARSVSCSYQEGCGDGRDQTGQLSVQQSNCIQAKSCSDLIASGTCGQLSGGQGTPISVGEVCR